MFILITNILFHVGKKLFICDNNDVKKYDFKTKKLHFMNQIYHKNTGAIIRTCSCFDVMIEIIEPCGFMLNDKRFKRVVMDYLDEKTIRFYKNYDDFFQLKKNKERIILMTTKASTSYTNFKFKVTDTILFGRESAGVPEKVHKLVDNRLKIPLSFKKDP